MGKHSVADAKNNLSELIDRTVVQLTPISPPPEPVTPEAVDWLKERRVGRRLPREHAAAAVRSIRDEWTRAAALAIAVARAQFFPPRHSLQEWGEAS